MGYVYVVPLIDKQCVAGCGGQRGEAHQREHATMHLPHAALAIDGGWAL
jgi:hypothetical protein